MLFGNHTMTMVNDIRIVQSEINNIDFVSVAAVTGAEDFDNPNIYNAAILMPPTDILMAWADGNALILQNEYPKYLMEKEPDDMIVALLAAMTKKNIILYIPNDEFNIFGQMLLNHIYFIYGIIMNTPTSVFAFDDSKLPIILSKFYMVDLMEASDFLFSYPAKYKLLDFTINKLAMELHPFNAPTPWIQYAEYFNNIVKNNNTEKQIMIRKV